MRSFESVTVPQKDNLRLNELGKRIESYRPMGVFMSGENEVLLCYDGVSLARGLGSGMI